VKYRGRPILAAISGFFLGVFLALDLVLFGIVQLDNIIVTLLPIIGLVVGVALAWWAPFGRNRAAGPTAVSQ
jgi:hypothetical protein